jgi:hypothetical protein
VPNALCDRQKTSNCTHASSSTKPIHHSRPDLEVDILRPSAAVRHSLPRCLVGNLQHRLHHRLVFLIRVREAQPGCFKSCRRDLPGIPQSPAHIGAYRELNCLDLGDSIDVRRSPRLPVTPSCPYTYHVKLAPYHQSLVLGPGASITAQGLLTSNWAGYRHTWRL